MAKIKFSNGITVNFDGEPTEKDIEEISKKIQGQVKPIQKITEPKIKEPEKKSVARKVGEFLLPGTSKLSETLGEAIATKTKNYKEAQKSQEALTDINVKLSKAIVEAKKQGKDTSRMERLYKENTERVFIPEEVAPSILKTTKQITGEALGTVVDIAGFGSFGSTVLGGAVAKQAISKTIAKGAIVGAGWGAMGAGTSAMAEGESNKEIVKSIGIGVGAGAVLGGILIPAASTVISKIKNVISPSISYLTGKLESSFVKGVKPLLSKMKTPFGRIKYYEKATEAIHLIASNKNSLQFTDNITGEIIKGRNPKNLIEFSDAIDQTKKMVFNAYDELVKKADSKMFVDGILPPGKYFDIKPVVNKINSFTKDLKYSPKIRQYAAELIPEVQELAGSKTSVIQDRVKELNSSLAGFYEGRINKYKAQIDASVAGLLRTELNNTIEKLSGSGGYSKLKSLYGSLLTIEKDVNRRALAVSRLQPVGLSQSITDVFSGGELIMGALTQNPAQMAKGLGMKTITNYVKYLNSPDRQVKSIFNYMDNILKVGSKPSLLDEFLLKATKEYNYDKKIIQEIKNIKPGLSIEDVSEKELNNAIKELQGWTHKLPGENYKTLSELVEKLGDKYKPSKRVKLYRGLITEQELDFTHPTSWTYNKEAALEHTYGNGKVVSKIFNPEEILIDSTEMPFKLAQKAGFIDEEAEVIIKTLGIAGFLGVGGGKKEKKEIVETEIHNMKIQKMHEESLEKQKNKEVKNNITNNEDINVKIENYIKNIKVNIKNIENSVAKKLNNPGNLIYAGQPNAVKVGRFAKFPTPEIGFRALIKQIQSDQKKDLTLEKFINKYAPQNENDTNKYILNAENELNINKNIKIKEINPIELSKFIAKFESGTIVSEI